MVFPDSPVSGLLPSEAVLRLLLTVTTSSSSVVVVFSSVSGLFEDSPLRGRLVGDRLWFRPLRNWRGGEDELLLPWVGQGLDMRAGVGFFPLGIPVGVPYWLGGKGE